MRSFKKGFTLIELLTVISIIGILATIVFASVSQDKAHSDVANVQAQLEQIQTAFQLYYEYYGDYPPNAPNGRDFCNWCTIPDNNYYANYAGINNPTYLQQWDTDPVTGQPYAWSTLITQLQQAGVLDPSAKLLNDPWDNPYVYDKNYQQTSGCNGWSPVCSMGPNGAIDTNNCQPWPDPPSAGGDDICIFLPDD